MKITFIRHASLQEPFDNYDQLSLDEINKLAKGAIDPDIDGKSQQIIENTLSRLKSVGGSVAIFHSGSKRAKQTSELIKKTRVLYGKKIKLIEFDALNEIYFEPKKMISFKEYKLSGLTKIRSAMFSHLSKNQVYDGVESIESVLARVKRIEKKIQQLSKKYDSIICVTHGFLMRVLQLYFLYGIKSKKSVTQDNLFKMINFPNCDGFFIEFTKGQNLSQKRNQERIEAFKVVRNLPYKISSPDKDSSCVTKNRIMAEIFQRQGYSVEFFQGKFKWESINLPKQIIRLAPSSHKPRHVFIKITIPEIGRSTIVDVTWSKNVNKAIQPAEWTGFTDSGLAVNCSDIHQLNVDSPDEIKKGQITSEYKKFIEKINEYLEEKND